MIHRRTHVGRAVGRIADVLQCASLDIADIAAHRPGRNELIALVVAAELPAALAKVLPKVLPKVPVDVIYI